MLDATFWVTFLWNVSVLLFYLGTFICVLNWIWSCKGNQISSNQISSSDVSYFIAKSNVPSFLPSLFWSVVVADCSICSSVDVPFPLHRYKACLACFYHGRMFVECCSLTVVSCQVQEIWTLLMSLFGDTDSLLPSAEGCICSQLYQLVQEPQGWRHNQFIADLKVSEGRVLFYMTSV